MEKLACTLQEENQQQDLKRRVSCLMPCCERNLDAVRSVLACRLGSPQAPLLVDEVSCRAFFGGEAVTGSIAGPGGQLSTTLHGPRWNFNIVSRLIRERRETRI